MVRVHGGEAFRGQSGHEERARHLVGDVGEEGQALAERGVAGAVRGRLGAAAVDVEHGGGGRQVVQGEEALAVGADRNAGLQEADGENIS